MRRREFIRLAAVTGAALALSGCGSASSQAKEIQYFRYADNQSADYPTTQAGQRFADLVAERTGGRIQIRVYAESLLGDETSVIEQIQLGMIDFARVSCGALAAFAPRLNVLQMPYLYQNADQMWRVLDGDIGADFLSGLADISLYGMSWYDAGARSFYTRTRPIQTLEDLRGMTLRVQESQLMSDMILALGAYPVTLVFRDVYSSLQSGTIDGAENNFPSYESMSHYEVAKYYSRDEHMRVPELQIVSKTVMDAFSAEDQAIIRAAAQESAVYERQLWTERELQSRDIVLAAGVQIEQLAEGELERFQAAMAPLYDLYCADAADVVAAIRAT